MLFKVKYLVLVVTIAAFATVSFAQTPAKDKKEKPFNYAGAINKYWNASDDTVVGTANGAKITKAQLMKKMWYWQSALQLKNYLFQVCIEEAAKKEGVSYTKAELDAKKKEMVAQTPYGTLDALYQKVSPPLFDTYAVRELLIEKAAKKTLKITKEELEGYVKVRHILIKFSATEKDKAKAKTDAKAKIDVIYAKLKGGADFEKTAQESSEDSTASKGGDLGWINKDTQFVPQFKEAALKLKTGEMTEPVESTFGYHIIKADKVGKDADEKEIAEIKKMINDTKLRPAMQEWVSKVTTGKMDNLILPEPPPAPPTGPGGPGGPGGQMMPPPQRTAPPQPRPAPENNKINEKPKTETPPAPPTN